MLELELRSFVKKISCPQGTEKCFSAKPVLYLVHPDDQAKLLVTFVVIDFKRGELLYLILDTPKNRKRLQSSSLSHLLQVACPRRNPHCCVQVEHGKDFYAFFEDESFFFYCNYRDKIFRIYTSLDVLPDKNPGSDVKFGSTFYKNPGQQNIYITAARKKGNDSSVGFYEVPLKYPCAAREVARIDGDLQTPHATRAVGNMLISSDFAGAKLMHEQSGTVFHTPIEACQFIYRELFRSYCRIKKRVYSEKLFRKENKIGQTISLESDFLRFCSKKGENVFAICRKEKGLRLTGVPGRILSVNRKKSENVFYQTTRCSPAHFELNRRKDIIYISSHNFSYLDRLYFLGPAAIDAFGIEGGLLKKMKTFSDGNAYRFTSHKVFSWKGEDYLCSFGQPNRLYVIHAGEMETLYHEDIGENYISGRRDLTQYLNDNFLRHRDIEYKALLVSDSGGMCLFADNSHVILYNLFQRRIEGKMKYKHMVPLPGGLPLQQLNSCTIHFGELR